MDQVGHEIVLEGFHARASCLSLFRISNSELESRARAAVSGKLVSDKTFPLVRETDNAGFF